MNFIRENIVKIVTFIVILVVMIIMGVAITLMIFAIIKIKNDVRNTNII